MERRNRCESSFGQTVRKLPKSQRKVLYDETYFEESNINRKPHIWSQDNIITKFGQKKKGEFAFAQSVRNCMKIKENCYLTKLTSKRVISI